MSNNLNILTELLSNQQPKSQNFATEKGLKTIFFDQLELKQKLSMNFSEKKYFIHKLYKYITYRNYSMGEGKRLKYTI